MNIANAAKRMRSIFKETPLEYCNLSNKSVYLKREDLTPVRSYKIRGAYNKMSSLVDVKNIVTCSAGNHAQGVAFSCEKLKIKGSIFMPKITPKQKIDKVKQFGKNYVSIHLIGENFDECFVEASNYCSKEKQVFIHPFDDLLVIEGQGTVGYEILNQINKPIDYIILPIGGGGLAAGVSTYMKEYSHHTKIIGVEPLGAPSMYDSLKQNKVVTLDKINTFVDGASVKKVGDLNFPICRDNLETMLLIDEGHVCSKIIQMYNTYGYIIEPAGVLSLCALDIVDLKGNVVCVISGGNSDIFRIPEIIERSLFYEKTKSLL